MIKKPGWEYIYSNALNQEIAYHLGTGWVFCKDGTKYSPKEISMLMSASTHIPVKVHIVKKMFKGEVFKIESAEKTDNKEPQNKKILKPLKTEIPAEKNGELEIW